MVISYPSKPDSVFSIMVRYWISVPEGNLTNILSYSPLLKWKARQRGILRIALGIWGRGSRAQWKRHIISGMNFVSLKYGQRVQRREWLSGCLVRRDAWIFYCGKKMAQNFLLQKKVNLFLLYNRFLRFVCSRNCFSVYINTLRAGDADLRF